MKKNICMLSLIAILGWACSKNTETAPEKPKYDVTFSVSGISSITDKISTPGKQQSLTATSNPHDVVPNVELYVYNAKGHLVASITEPCCGSEEGILIEGLELGTYSAIAVGHRGIQTSGLDMLSTAGIALQNHDAYYGEVFLDKVDFEVKSVENNQVNLMLKRKVGLLTVDITDTPPNDVSYVSATIYSVSYVFHFNDFMSLYTDYYPSFVQSYYGQSGYFSGYFFVPNNSGSYNTSVLLEVVGTNGKVLKTKWVENVTVGTNIRTTIRGKLFEPNAQGFTIEIDTEWNGENTIDF